MSRAFDGCLVCLSAWRGQLLLRLLLLSLIVSLPACGSFTRQASLPGSSGGKYYKDDGPGRNPPGDLETRPDATPRHEPVKKATTRPYRVLGKRYYPHKTRRHYKERGNASWYGRKFHGRKTATGEIYDMYAMTAAHKTLALPSYARVSNPGNGRSVVVRVNDRGPFHPGRIIDLSYAAAHRLGILRRGSGEVIVETILSDGSSYAGKDTPRQASAITTTSVAPQPVPPPGVYLQLGSFTSRNNAETLRSRLPLEIDNFSKPVTVVPAFVDGATRYRVQAGPYLDDISASVDRDYVARRTGQTPWMLRVP